MRSRALAVLACLATLVAAPAFAARPAPAAGPAPLVPRSVLFGEFTDDVPRLSPDGKQLAWAHRGDDGIVNQWVRDLATGASRQVTHDKRGVHGAAWTHDGKRLLFLGDNEGDENQHLFALDLATGQTRDLTPFPDTRVEDFFGDPRRPNELLVGMNRRDPRVFDLHRVNLTTGDVTLDTQNPGDVIAWATDEQFRVRGATALRAADAATILRVRDDEHSPWRDLVTWPFLEAGFDRDRRILGFADGGTALLVQSCIGHNTSALVTLDARTGAERAVLAHDPRCDLWSEDDAAGGNSPRVLLSADDTKVLAVGFDPGKPEWKVIDRSVAPDFAALQKLAAGSRFEVVSRDASDRQWVVDIGRDTSPGRTVLWDRRTRKATPLFEIAPELARWTFAPVEPVTFRARDGLMIGGYLTLPVGVPARGLPLVVNVHGGPWHHDAWGWNPEVQWLANRGYAVLQVNFRGSTGRGVRYLNAGDREFGPGAVLHDVVDGARWLVGRGLADSTRVGLMGWSFGGYATLCGLAFEPDLFACGVDGVGPSRVSTLLNSFPPYWGPRRVRWLQRFGDATADSALDRRLSPIFHVDAMRAPLLIGHGANDPRVKLVESEEIVRAMRDAKRDVTFIVYPDEGHGFGRAENNEDFYGRVEEFLAKRLGGRVEPWREVPGSTAQVR